MNSSYFEVFLAMAETRNVSRAAEKLFLSQSTVSHRLKMLEEELGCPLFERAQGQRVCTLTAKGEAFLPLARRWVELNEDIKSFPQMDLSAVLTVGAVDSVNQCILYGLYTRLLEEDLPFRLDIRTYGNRILYNNVANGLVDIAFTVEQNRNKAIETQELFCERMVFVCRAGQYHAGAIHPHELDPADEIAIIWDDREMQFWHDQWFSPHAEGFLTINAPAFVSHFFKGATWAIVPVSVGINLRERYGMELHELLFPPPKRICYKLLARHQRPERVGYVQTFERYLEEYLSELRWIETDGGERKGHTEDGVPLG